VGATCSTGHQSVRAISGDIVASLRTKFDAVLPNRDERQRRPVRPANTKTLEGAGHPDWNAQFSYLNEPATKWRVLIIGTP
jgi:hypothetical protein